MNRLSLEGQIHGGTAQGLGLALMEEIQVRDGIVRNPSFTDYLIPTILDMPPMRMGILEIRRPARALRPARRRRTPDSVLHPGRRRRHPRGARQGPHQGSDRAGGHHRPRAR